MIQRIKQFWHRLKDRYKCWRGDHFWITCQPVVYLDNGHPRVVLPVHEKQCLNHGCSKKVLRTSSKLSDEELKDVQKLIGDLTGVNYETAS